MRHSKRLNALEQAQGRAAAPTWPAPAFIDSLDRIYGAGDGQAQPLTWASVEAALDRIYGGDDEARETTAST